MRTALTFACSNRTRSVAAGEHHDSMLILSAVRKPPSTAYAVSDTNLSAVDKPSVVRN